LDWGKALQFFLFLFVFASEGLGLQGSILSPFVVVYFGFLRGVFPAFFPHTLARSFV